MSQASGYLKISLSALHHLLNEDERVFGVACGLFKWNPNPGTFLARGPGCPVRQTGRGTRQDNNWGKGGAAILGGNHLVPLPQLSTPPFWSPLACRIAFSSLAPTFAILVKIT